MVKIHQPVHAPEPKEAYYQLHKDKIKAQIKKWNADNPDKRREYNRRYREKDPEKYREQMRIGAKKFREKNNNL
jgi:hypothetical protein